MSPGWDNGSELSAHVGHGSKKVSAKARGRVGFKCPKGYFPINIHAFPPSPANFVTLVASSSTAVADLLKAWTTRVAFSKEGNKCAQVVFFTECSFHNCRYSYPMTFQKINPVA